MQISKASINRPVTTLMMVLMVVLLGIVSLSRLKLDLMPSIDMPYAIVSVSYTGAGPEEIESLITKPMESTLGTVSNLSELQSRSSNGSSLIILEFNDNTDMDIALLDVREKIDLVKGSLPEDATTPIVFKLNPTMMPVMMLAVSSESSDDLVELNNIAEDNMQSRLERINGVASVDIYGGRELEVSVYVYPDKLKGYGITVTQISQLLSAENLNMPVGTIKQGDADLTVRTIGEFVNVEEIREMPITTPIGATIHLRDVALVEQTYKDQTSYTYMNGKKAVTLSIQKQSDANTVEVAEAVNAEIELLKKELPDLIVTSIMDQSTYINSSINGVASSALYGAAFAVLVLFIFLRNVRSTLVVGTAIPLSIIATFMLMDYSGVTLNVVSLGGLALGVGMLVDNAIVVLENIFRHRELGKSRVNAAIDGVKEVGMAVTASTLTTVAVFLPMLFVEGIAGKIFKELALTVSFSLVASLAVAMTWVPMASSKVLKISKYDPDKKMNILQKLLEAWGKVLDGLDNIYRRFLNWAVRRKKIVCLAVIAFFIGTIMLVPTIGMEFFASGDEGALTIDIEMPKGTLIEETSKVAFDVSERLETIEEVKELYVSVGGTSMFTSGGDSASIMINLVDVKERNRSAQEITEECRNLTKDIAGADISVTASSSTSMSSTGGDISIEVYGDDFEQLTEISEEIKSLIDNVDGTREVTTSMQEGTPEAAIRINRSKASLYGISASQVASALNTAVMGTVSTQFKHDGTEIDIRIKQDPTNINYITDIENIMIQSNTGAAIPLKEIAEVANQKGPITITRLGQERYITVDASVYGRDLNSVSQDVMGKLASYEMPAGYSYQMAGQSQEMMDSFASLIMALLLAIVLVYMIMAAQFESLRYPFIVLMSIPLAMTGGLMGLIIMRTNLSILGMIGLIMLAGIVVNNAIVLVDYINQLRKGGMGLLEAIVEAGPTRLRPILMTTLTTVLGLLPMMLSSGDGSEMQRPLAIVVVFGLSISTIVTLVFVPVVYAIMENFKEIVKGILRIKPKLDN